MIVIKNKCPYCFYKLAKDGFCARPCKMGALKRKQAELKQKQEQDNGNDIGNAPVAEATKE